MPHTDHNHNDQQHIFFRSADGHVQHIFWDQLSQKLQSDIWTLRTSAPLAVGDVASLITECRQQVFYRDVRGQIHYIFWDVASASLHHVALTQLAEGAPLAVGNPMPLETPGQVHVFYRGVDGTLEHIFWNTVSDHIVFTDSWTTRAHATPLVGDPAVLSTAGQQHAFYRGSDGHIHHVVWNAETLDFGVDDWTAKAHAPSAAAEPAAIAVGNQQHIFYRGAAGNINHIVWAPSSSGPRFDDWTESSGAPRIAGNRVATMLASGQQHVFYRALNGGIVHILWSPFTASFGWDDWTQSSGAPAAAEDPATLTTEGQQHVFYTSATGSIVHILWNQAAASFGWDDWTLNSGAAPAASSVAAVRSLDVSDSSGIRILPLGDSMTEGFAVQGTGGYRAPLFRNAHSAGRRIIFVGSLFDGPARVDGACFPRAHEGHSGRDIEFITGEIPKVLANKPKIVLLMIGANDVLALQRHDFKQQILDSAPTRLGKLLDELLIGNPGMLLAVAKIPPMSPLNPPPDSEIRKVPHHDWIDAIQKYNTGVAAAVNTRVASGKHVVLADMHSGFDGKSMWGCDQIHPNEKGYEFMAAIWFQTISGFLV